jgi:hypothetical protein
MRLTTTRDRAPPELACGRHAVQQNCEVRRASRIFPRANLHIFVNQGTAFARNEGAARA